MTNADKPRILLVDDEQDLLESCLRILEGENYDCITTANSLEVPDLLREKRPWVVVTDFLMPGKNGLEILVDANRISPRTPVIMISAYATVERVVEAVKVGAFDYLTKPFSSDQLVITVRRAVERYRLGMENDELRKKLRDEFFSSFFVGKHPRFISIQEQIYRIAPTQSSVLIQGETGTGKELAARAIHLYGNRADKPFIVADCSTLSEEMLRTAPFDGADSGKPRERSLFEAANGGTIYLEQVEDLDMAMQARLLRILQDRRIQQGADWQWAPLDIRVIASSTVNLQDAVYQKKFRENLYYCLNVIGITIPPLRERKEDITVLCDHFLRQMPGKNGLPLKVLHPDALARLMAYDWPGNVRELRNVIERAASMSDEKTIMTKHLQDEVLNADGTGNLTFREARKLYLDKFEKLYLENLLLKNNGNISRASEHAGITRMSFYRILKRIGLVKDVEWHRAGGERRQKQDEEEGNKGRPQ